MAGAAWGKVKALVDDRGDHVKEALPSTPVQVLGLLRAAARRRRDAGRQGPGAGPARSARPGPSASGCRGTSRWPPPPGAKLEDLFEQIPRGETATLNLVLKADVQGSLEAVTESLKLERDDVKLSFVLRGIGGITENDVQLAAASNATIIGFNVRPDRRSRELAEASDVEIRTYEIIYKLLEDIEAAMLGLLVAGVRGGRHRRGRGPRGLPGARGSGRSPAATSATARSPAARRCGSCARASSSGREPINSLRRFKDDVREVAAGFECGIGLSDFQDLKEGDIIETFEEREIART